MHAPILILTLLLIPALRIIAFVLDPPTTERILRHIDQPHELPAVLPAARTGGDIWASDISRILTLGVVQKAGAGQNSK